MALANTALPGRSSPDSRVYLTDHLMIIRALIFRMVRVKFMRAPAGFLLEFFQPTLSCVAHYFIFWAVSKGMPPGMSLEQFIWGAFTPWLTFSQTYHVLERLPGSKAPPIPGVTAMHARLVHVVWNIVSKGAFCYGSVAIMIVFGDNITFPNVPLTALILVLAATLGMGLGMSIEGICRVAPALDSIFHMLSYGLFITAGIYFSVSTSPLILMKFFVYNPLLHLVEYERYAFDPGYPVNLVSLTYPLAWAAGLLLSGLLINRRLSRKQPLLT